MTREQQRAEDESYRKWTGAYKPYDLIKEATIATLGVIVAVIVLSFLFSSPDDPAITMKSWSRAAPVDFATIATSELDGTSVTAGYGPPYNHNGNAQQILFIKPAQWIGVTHPINTEQDFVVKPLRLLTSVGAVQTALSTWQSASAKQQAAWSTAYTNALGKATGTADSLSVPAGNYGPVSTIIGALTTDAQSGGSTARW